MECRGGGGVGGAAATPVNLPNVWLRNDGLRACCGGGSGSDGPGVTIEGRLTAEAKLELRRCWCSEVGTNADESAEAGDTANEAPPEPPLLLDDEMEEGNAPGRACVASSAVVAVEVDDAFRPRRESMSLESNTRLLPLIRMLAERPACDEDEETVRFVAAPDGQRSTFGGVLCCVRPNVSVDRRVSDASSSGMLSLRATK